MSGITINELYETYGVTDPSLCHPACGFWLMDRSSYDQVRALSGEQAERDRAAIHANVLVAERAESPLLCPACAMGPFGSATELREHVARLADPDYREPSAGDRLFGLPIEVRDGAGRPRIAARTWP